MGERRRDVITWTLRVLVPRATLIAVPLLLCVLVGAFLAHIFIIGVGVPHSVIVAVLFAMVVTIGWRHRH